MANKGMMWFDWIAYVLLVVGGLNWGLVGAFNFNLVMYLLGEGLVANIVYGLVGISAVYGLYMLFKLSK